MRSSNKERILAELMKKANTPPPKKGDPPAFIQPLSSVVSATYLALCHTSVLLDTFIRLFPIHCTLPNSNPYKSIFLRPILKLIELSPYAIKERKARNRSSSVRIFEYVKFIAYLGSCFPALTILMYFSLTLVSPKASISLYTSVVYCCYSPKSGYRICMGPELLSYYHTRYANLTGVIKLSHIKSITLGLSSSS